MTRHLGLWGVVLICVLGVAWTISRSPNTSLRNVKGGGYAPPLGKPFPSRTLFTATPAGVIESGPPRATFPAQKPFFVSLDQTPLESFDESPDHPIDGAVEMNAVLARFQIWKDGHRGSLAPLISLYAPQASIDIETSTALTPFALKQTLDPTHRGQIAWRFDIGEVQDCSFNEGEVALKTTIAYGKPGSSFKISDCQIFWHNIKGHWLIVYEAWQQLPGNALPIPTPTPSITTQPDPVYAQRPDPARRKTLRRTRETEEVRPRLIAWQKSFGQSLNTHLSFYTADAKVHLPDRTLTRSAFRNYEAQEWPRTTPTFEEVGRSLGTDGSYVLFNLPIPSAQSPDKSQSVFLFWHKVGKQWLIAKEWRDVLEPYPWHNPDFPPLVSTRITPQTVRRNEERFADQVASISPSWRSSPDDTAIIARYEAWKKAHQGPIAALRELYTPDAKIYLSTLPQTREQFCALMQRARDTKTYDQISDLSPSRGSTEIAPQLVHIGDYAELRIRSYYTDTGDGSWRSGKRRLIWYKQDGIWRIISDWFPTTYAQGIASPLPQPTATPLPTPNSFGVE